MKPSKYTPPSSQSTSQTRHLVGLATLRAAFVLAVDVDDVADGDHCATVGAGFGVDGRSLGGHASHAGIVGEVAAGQRRATRRFIDLHPEHGSDDQKERVGS